MSGRCQGAECVSEAAWDTLSVLVSPWFVIPAFVVVLPAMMVFWLAFGPLHSARNTKKKG